MRSEILLTCLLGAGLASVAAAQSPIDVRRSVRPDAAIKIWNGGGFVRVEAGDPAAVEVRGRVLPGPGEFFLVGDERAVKLGLQASFGDGAAELTVRVPPTATVWIRTASARVAVWGLLGSVDVHTVSGAVVARGEPEHLWAESMGGDVTLEVHASTVRGRAGSGRLSFRGAAEDLTLETIGGDLDVAADPVSLARLATVDGSLRYTGSLVDDGALAVESHAGPVVLALPLDLNATFDLYSFRGPIRIEPERGTTGSSGDDPRRLRFATGSSQATVTVETFSGTILVTATTPGESVAAPDGGSVGGPPH